MSNDVRRTSREDIETQEAICSDIRARTGGGVYCVVTYGCQMNAHDSEMLAGYLTLMGYTEGGVDEADIVIFNTCCIRDNAERRVFGNVGALKERKLKNPDMLIAVCGCMMQQEGAAEKLLRRMRFVDLIFGTGQVWRLPEMMRARINSKTPLVFTDDINTLSGGGMSIKRAGGPLAYITVMQGCDNYCSYCIVPYVRGRQRSRSPEDIVAEARALADEGVKEIMLLGQNVNSYGLDNGGISFARLLERLDGVVPRIRFMTSHPKDLGDDLIRAIAGLGSVCPQLHLPVQSGSDAVLAAMNRGYTRAQYLERIARLRDAVPDIGLTTDFIVAFPGETERDFEDTLSLAEEVRFDAAYTFIYSPRKGTAAAALDGMIDKTVARGRIERLIDVQEGITRGVLRALVGQAHSVLVEKGSKRDAQRLMGKIARGQTVNFAGDRSLIGAITDVTITAASHNTLKGETP